MKARYYALILVLLVVLAGAAYYVSASMMAGTQTGQTNSYGTGSTGGTGSGYQTNPPPTQNQPSTYQIDIRSFAFNPQTLTIKQGDTVVWTNYDTAPHTATSDTNAFASSTLSTGGTFQYTFQNAGTYTYHCSVHLGMTGTIVVTQ